MKKFRVVVDGVKYEVEVEEVRESNTPLRAPSPWAPPLSQPMTPSMQNTAAVGGSGIVKAPMPGAILDVRVKEGTEVALGEVLCILEAMKMENEVLADKAGIVKEVRVSPGQSVGVGDVLVIIE